MLFTVQNGQLVRVKELPETGYAMRTTYQRIKAFEDNHKGVSDREKRSYVTAQLKAMTPQQLVELGVNLIPSCGGQHPIGSLMICSLFKDDKWLGSTPGLALLHPIDRWKTQTALYTAASRCLSEFAGIDHKTLVNEVCSYYLRS